MSTCLSRLREHCVVLLLASLGSVAIGLPAAAQAVDGASSPDALYRAGYEAYNRGDLAAAHARFARLIELAPKVAVGHAAYGEVLLAQGDPAAALEQLTLARQLDPKAPAAEIGIANAWLALGDSGKAADAFRDAALNGAVLSPDENRAYGAALAEAGQAEQAISVLEAALRASGQAPLAARERAMLEDALGTLLAQRGNIEQASQHFTAAATADPDLASAHGHLGSAALVQHQPEAAVTELRRAVALAPAEPGYTIELGRALTALGQDAEAISVLRHASALAEDAQVRAGRLSAQEADNKVEQRSATPAITPTPGKRAAPVNEGGKISTNPIAARSAAKTLEQAHYALALALQAGGQPAEALPLFAAYVKNEPGDSAGLTNYALAMVQTGDAKHAVPLYQQALALDPGSATLHEDYGVAYLQQSDLDHALEQFKQGLALEPENPHLHYDLGLAYKLKDNLAAAIPEFERAEQIDPTLPDPAYTLGVIHMQQGEFAAAAVELEKTVALQPGNGAAWAVLGNVYKEDGDPAKASTALRRAITLDPAQPSTRISLAAILAQDGDKEGAAAERKQAAELSRVAVSRQRASFALKSGRALLDQAKFKEAEAQFRTAIAADPHDPAAHAALAEALAHEGLPADAAVERQQAADLASAPSANAQANPQSHP